MKVWWPLIITSTILASRVYHQDQLLTAAGKPKIKSTSTPPTMFTHGPPLYARYETRRRDIVPVTVLWQLTLEDLLIPAAQHQPEQYNEVPSQRKNAANGLWGHCRRRVQSFPLKGRKEERLDLGELYAALNQLLYIRNFASAAALWLHLFCSESYRGVFILLEALLADSIRRWGILHIDCSLAAHPKPVKT